MKKFIFAVSALLIAYTSYSQDLLGSKLTEVRKTTKTIKGVNIAFSGDSVLKVNNSHMARKFQFKFDASTKVCYQEDIQLNVNDLRNRIIVDKLLHSKSMEVVDVNEKESLYSTRDKIICIRQSGNMVSIFFTLKKMKAEQSEEVANRTNGANKFDVNAELLSSL